MQQLNLGMIGGGTVGSGVFHAWQENGDLMAARKKYHRVKATDSLISLSSLTADLDDASPIEPTLKKAIYIAERFEAAAKKA